MSLRRRRSFIVRLDLPSEADMRIAAQFISRAIQRFNYSNDPDVRPSSEALWRQMRLLDTNTVSCRPANTKARK